MNGWDWLGQIWKSEFYENGPAALVRNLSVLLMLVCLGLPESVCAQTWNLVE